MITRWICLTWFIVCLFFLQPVWSQYYFYNETYFDAPVLAEISFSAGGMNGLTDLGGNRRSGFGRDVNWKFTRLTGSLAASVLIRGILGARLELSAGRVTAADSILPVHAAGSYGRRLRNLHFQSTIKELACIVEFHPLSMPGVLINGPPGISPYVFAGLGYFGFKPEALLNQVVVDLHSLHTEGQGFAEYPHRHSYALKQWNLPLGLGVRYEASAKSSVRFEVNYRKLWTDYLDDVSTTYIDPAIFQTYLDHSNARIARAVSDRSLKTDPQFSTGPGQIRGNEQNNDAYFSFQLKFSLVLGRTRRW